MTQVIRDRRQETGDVRQETRDRRQETGDGRQVTRDRRKEKGDGRQVTRDRRQETGDGRQETGTGDGRPKTGESYIICTNIQLIQWIVYNSLCKPHSVLFKTIDSHPVVFVSTWELST